MKISRITRRFTRLATIVLLVVFGLVYVAAKIDFFRRFDPNNVSGFVAGHWVFWVAMAALVGLMLVLVKLGPNKQEVSSKDEQA